MKHEDDYFYPHPDVPIKTPKRFLTDFGGFYYDECDKQWKLEQYSSYGWEGYKRNKIKVRKKEK